MQPDMTSWTHVTRSILCGNLQGKCRTRIPRHSFCASLRSRKPHGVQDISQEPVWMEITRKMPDSNPADSIFCASLRGRNAHGHVTRSILCKKTGKMPHAYPATPILCEPAQSKYTWTCHKKQFVRKFTGKMPDATDTTSIEHRAFTLTVRTPSVWPRCLGKNFSKTREACFSRTNIIYTLFNQETCSDVARSTICTNCTNPTSPWFLS